MSCGRLGHVWNYYESKRWFRSGMKRYWECYWCGRRTKGHPRS